MHFNHFPSFLGKANYIYLVYNGLHFAKKIML
jgi:hypothetical protein